MSVCLILSSAFVGQELAAEFGRLPPSFLPVGMRRLYELQLDRIGAEHTTYLTLPDSFALPSEDAALLEKTGVTVLSIPLGLRLGEAVVYACNLIGVGESPLAILHGDTLVDLPATDKADLVAIAEAADGYSWAEVGCDADGLVTSLHTLDAGDPDGHARPVACGYFGASSAARLVRCIVKTRGDFVAGLSLYASETPMQTVSVQTWYDFGHLRTFYRSRRLVTTARAFNSLQIDGVTVRKRSATDGAKIAAEARWFSQLPPTLRPFSARLLHHGVTPNGENFYDTEYEYLPTLAELAVFGSLDTTSWSHILTSCADFLKLCTEYTNADGNTAGALQALVLDKTVVRLERFAAETKFPIDAPLTLNGVAQPSLSEIAGIVAAQIDWSRPVPTSVMHGDFCFSNILYNSRVRRVRVIDPRGHIDNVPSIFGDVRYDIAKLGHSVIGRYDDIIAGRYRLSNTLLNYSLDFGHAAAADSKEDIFRRTVLEPLHVDATEIHAIIVGLFLSMLPLHADRPDRQMAFIANALRLFGEL